MAVCMNKSVSRSSISEESDVFESQIVEGNDRENILSLHNESRFPRSASRFNLPPMSAPPIVNRNFQFGAYSSFVDESTKLPPIAAGNHNLSGIAHIQPIKSRSKSLSFVQPACLFLKQYQERITTTSCCPTVNTLSTLKWRLQSSSYNRSSVGLPLNTLGSEQPIYPYPLGSGVSIQIANSVEVSLLSCGPLINAPSSPIIGIMNTPEQGYSPGKNCRICLDGEYNFILQ